MKKFNLRNVIINYNENKNNLDFLSLCKNCVYLIKFPDETIYIGCTKQSLFDRLVDHCKLSKCDKSLRAEKTRAFKEITISVLKNDINENELKLWENKYIHEIAKFIYNKLTNEKTDFKSYSKYHELINKCLLNRISL